LDDEDLSSDIKPSYVGKSHFFNIWGNLIGECGHLKGVLRALKEDKYLGVLLPPTSDFGEYFGKLDLDWCNKYNMVYEVIERQNINCVCSRDKKPFSVSKSLWLKKDVLKKLSGFTEEDRQLIGYLWIYLSQEQGYYSGTVESIEYATMSEVNKSFYLEDLVGQVSTQYGIVSTYSDVKKYISYGAVSVFSTKFEKIYVYGIGQMAREYKPYIHNLCEYIVSDGQLKPDEYEGKKVNFISEISVSDDIGIVVCLNKKNQESVCPRLESMGFKNYICI
jgi:hypothetical protein